MLKIDNLIKELKALIGILQEEKEALLNNKGHEVALLVEKKKEYIERLAEFKGLDIESNQRAMNLISQINQLQETNLLLTKQALSYQDVLIESIAKNINATHSTYSQKGGFNKPSSANLVDQSV